MFLKRLAELRLSDAFCSCIYHLVILPSSTVSVASVSCYSITIQLAHLAMEQSAMVFCNSFL